MARSKSSQKWLKEHFKDPFVQRAMKEGYRSRASYKLLEIQQKDHLIRPGMRVLDVGAAPGGWTQVAAPLIGKKGRLVAVDRLAMDPVADAIVICGDVYEDAVLAACRDALPGGADLIMSDMAPNMSGIASVDQARAIDLAELALDMAQRWLVPGGSLLIKVFMGSGAEDLRRALRRDFKKIVVRKPEASRARSTEQYWLALDFQRVAQERLDNGGASSL
ncbi:MAG: RlmE family RNA methyltransferase [Acidithiobacillus ferriphilus]|uniref:Ribosomal RNA large subunit methyltransferase E n=3 Tax=Acidithiobacillus TaxID=119977 RepID=A0A179BBE8_ACIFR|nr:MULTISPECIES: SAM-dependent methyltransferase [Acidithiobacillus]OYV82009.1 MAG: 23S rRNA methyltransferase [Acidithiobacillus ferrivorans]MBU2784863.1 23S rRNA methyltransferase [Acidithiobacillus ferriphilus]MBU2827613.1 23S rRNA methyltransferase [Acidithiobacillus ferriphilus]MBU2829728.1 23S rRNA methyltransferase [Acidithiobacillus ferriphilus]MBU2832221.1 23S rRNA methyltransferase [Acidithiobacillus ferriphilus]